MAKLSPFPRFRAFDSNGDPLVGGKLYSFIAGTTTPKTTFTDDSGGTPNANPTILDANGEADVWLDGNYKLQLDDADDVTLWTVDNIQQFNTAIAETLSPVAGANAFQLSVAGTINEAATGTHTLLGGVSITAPLINAAGASVTETASLYIDAAPSAVGATNYALHVDAGATQLDGTLDVDGAVTFATTLTATGNTTLSGTLGVTGATTLSSTLGVTGATTLSSTLGVTGATTLSDTLGVTGATTLSSTLGVTGATTLSSTLGVTGATTLSDTLEVTGATTLSSTLGVTGATTLSSTLDVTGFVTVNNNLRTINATPFLYLRDSDSTGSAAVGLIRWEDSAVATMAEVGFKSADANFEITNQLTGGSIELRTSGIGDVVVYNDTSPTIVLQDTGNAGVASRAGIKAQDSGGVAIWRMETDNTGDSNLTIQNQATGADIELSTLSGTVAMTGAATVSSTLGVTGATTLSSTLGVTGRITANDGLRLAEAAPVLWLRDTGATGASSAGVVRWEDSAAAVTADVGFSSSGDAHFEITNSLSGGNIELNTNNGRVVTDNGIIVLSGGNAALLIRDPVGVTTGASATFDIQDENNTTLSRFGFTSATDGHLSIENHISGGDMELLTTGVGNVVVYNDASPALILQDTGNAGVSSRGGIKAQDSAGVTIWRMETDSSSDSNLIIKNQATNADIELETTGTGNIVLAPAGLVEFGASGPTLRVGTGAPSASDPDGSLYLRTDGGAATTLYVRHSGTTWTALS